MDVRARIVELIDGPADQARTEVELRARWLLIVALGGANLAGALLVLVFATIVLPNPPGLADPGRVRLINIVIFSCYVLCGAPVGVIWGLWIFRPVRRLARHHRDLDEEERMAVLRGPLRLMVLQGVGWGCGAVGWAAVDAAFSPLLALKVGLITAMGGLMTCAIVYLLAERLLRPIAALALASVPPEAGWFGVAPRIILAWGLGSAVPILGMLIAAVDALTAHGISITQLAVTVLAVGGVALIVGFEVTYIATRAVADPVASVRAGLARLEQGDLQVTVPVYDASELGLLQAGFNRLVAGLRENERLRDLFGRHVGEDVARHALERGAALGGETCDVAVLFVDLAGSTRLAATRPPDEVVGLLNAFFGTVVEVITRNGGLINKFEGDAALAIFGAPAPLDDPRGRALAAARELAGRLRADLPELTAGVGVSAGTVVAGYIGAEERFEYTVIGDPVNEAARLSDLAKNVPDRVLAAAPMLERADTEEAAHWRTGRAVTLRGRGTRTRLAHQRRP